MNILFIIFKSQPKPNIQYHSSTLLYLILFLLSPLYSSHIILVKAQNFATLDSDSDPYFTAGIALTAIAVISFSVYIVIYLCFRRFFQPWAEQNRDHPYHTGIDPLILRTFPVINFTDHHILDLKPSKGLVECAVCLGLFERGETLRVLPKCGHVFHVGCVDPWLASHTTCPLCRANLVLKSVDLTQVESGCVDGLGCEVVEVNEVDDNNVIVVPMSREVVGVQPSGNIWRWNSTGHVARFDGMKDEGKSTVVRKEVIVRSELNRSKSCTIINMDLG